MAAGARAAIPLAITAGLVALSFPVLATDVGFSPLATVIMSAVVFAGSAQFTAVAVLAQGAGAGGAIVAGTFMNSRYLPMGIALGPSLPGGPAKRALQGQAVVDGSWALAAHGDGTFDRWRLFGATIPQFIAWVGGTALGVALGDRLSDPDALGLDAIYPAYFLALLMVEARNGRSRGVAAAGAAIALILTPFAPAGLPVLLASVAALIGLVRR